MEIGEALAAQVAKESTTLASGWLTKIGRKRYDKFIATYTKAFTAHLEWARAKTTHVKNLIYRDQSGNLEDIYVQTNFGQDDELTSATDLVKKIIESQKIVISGTGGAGKTMFLRWSVGNLISTLQHHQKIPLFLELREIADSDFDSLSHILFEKCSSQADPTSFNQFLEGLKAGVFCVLLDAVDEAAPAIRERLINEIERFAISFPLVGMIVTTRPDPRTENLTQFSVFRTLPMSKEQVILLIDKLSYQEDIKKSLIRKIDEGLYEKHKSFLSNPLLVTIMLLTYDRSLDIPLKLSQFYREAFETLYQRHDATKIYKRNPYAGLPIDEFQTVFSTFCFITYVKFKSEFSDTELLSHFREATEISGIEGDPEAILKDAIEGACLIQKEGLDNVFSHRSFQEYFTALFICQYRGDNIFDLISLVIEKGFSETVDKLVYEMDPYLFEKYYTIPKTEKILNKLHSYDVETPSGLRGAMKFYASNIGLMRNYKIYSVSVDSGGVIEFSHFMSGVYPEMDEICSIFADEAGPMVDAVDDFDTQVEEMSPARRKLMKLDLPVEERSSTYSQPHLVVEFTPADCKWLVRTNLPLIIKGRKKALETFLGQVRARVQEQDMRRTDVLAKLLV